MSYIILKLFTAEQNCKDGRSIQQIIPNKLQKNKNSSMQASQCFRTPKNKRNSYLPGYTAFTISIISLSLHRITQDLISFTKFLEKYAFTNHSDKFSIKNLSQISYMKFPNYFFNEKQPKKPSIYIEKNEVLNQMYLTM